MSKGRTKLSFLYYSLLFTYCQFISRSVFSFLMFVSKNVVRFAPIEAERRKNCESTKYETIHMASHNFHNFTKFDRSNYDLKCKKSDAWFW